MEAIFVPRLLRIYKLIYLVYSNAAAHAAFFMPKNEHIYINKGGTYAQEDLDSSYSVP